MRNSTARKLTSHRPHLDFGIYHVAWAALTSNSLGSSRQQRVIKQLEGLGAPFRKERVYCDDWAHKVKAKEVRHLGNARILVKKRGGISTARPTRTGTPLTSPTHL